MEEIKSKLDKIDNSKLIPPEEIKILNELDKAQSPLFARDISEVYVSSNVVASRCKKLDEESGSVNRKK